MNYEAADLAAIGAALRERRRYLGLTIAEVAKLASKDPASIHRVEAGKQVRPKTLNAFADVLGLDPDWIEKAIAGKPLTGSTQNRKTTPAAIEARLIELLEQDPRLSADSRRLVWRVYTELLDK